MGPGGPRQGVPPFGGNFRGGTKILTDAQKLSDAQTQTPQPTPHNHQPPEAPPPPTLPSPALANPIKFVTLLKTPYPYLSIFYLSLRNKKQKTKQKKIKKRPPPFHRKKTPNFGSLRYNVPAAAGRPRHRLRASYEFSHARCQSSHNRTKCDAAILCVATKRISLLTHTRCANATCVEPETWSKFFGSIAIYATSNARSIDLSSHERLRLDRLAVTRPA